MSENQPASPAQPQNPSPEPAATDRCSFDWFGSRFLVPLIVLYFSSLVFTGYAVFCANQTHQIPLIAWLNDPNLFRGDPYQDALAHFASVLWRVVALGARVFPLEPLLLGCFLERLFLLCAAAYAGWAVAPKSRLAPLGAMVLFTCAVAPLIGDGTIVTYYFEQTSVAIGFLLLAFGTFHRQNRWWFALWLGTAFDVQSMYGLFAVTYFGAVFLFDRDYRSEWRRWIGPGVLCVVLVLPVVGAGLAIVNHQAVDRSLWIAASHVRSQAHLYPLTWGPTVFLQFATLIAIIIVALQRQRTELPRSAKHALVWSGVAVFWLLYTFAAAYVFKSPSMLVLQAARSSDLWVSFASITLVAACARKVEEHRPGDRAALLQVVALAGALMLWRPLAAFPLAALLLVVQVPAVWRRLLREGDPQRLANLVVGATAAICLYAGYHRVLEWRDLKTAFYASVDPDVKLVATWARRHTPADAVFLVSLGSTPDWENFRAISHRSIYTNYKEGGAINWVSNYVTAWDARLRAVGYDLRHPGDDVPEERLNEIFHNLTDQDIQRVQTQFRLDYWIASEGHASAYPVAFAAVGYKVLDVRPH